MVSYQHKLWANAKRLIFMAFCPRGLRVCRYRRQTHAENQPILYATPCQ